MEIEYLHPEASLDDDVVLAVTVHYPNQLFYHEKDSLLCWCEPIPTFDEDGDIIDVKHRDLYQ